MSAQNSPTFDFINDLTIRERLVKITLTPEQAHEIAAGLMVAYHSLDPQTEEEEKLATLWRTAAQMFEAAGIAGEQQMMLPVAVWQQWLEREQEGDGPLS